MIRVPELHPTGLRPGSLAAQVLDFMCQTRLGLLGGLLGLAAAAHVVAAECRFDYWTLTEVKKAGLSEEWWIRSLEEGEANNERCRAAIAALAAGGSLDVFCSELAAVAAFLNNRSL